MKDRLEGLGFRAACANAARSYLKALSSEVERHKPACGTTRKDTIEGEWAARADAVGKVKPPQRPECSRYSRPGLRARPPAGVEGQRGREKTTATPPRPVAAPISARGFQ